MQISLLSELVAFSLRDLPATTWLIPSFIQLPTYYHDGCPDLEEEEGTCALRPIGRR